MNPREYKLELQELLDKLRAARADPERIEKVKKDLADLHVAIGLMAHAKLAAQGKTDKLCINHAVELQPCIHDSDDKPIGILCNCCEQCRKFCYSPTISRPCSID